MSGYPPNDQHYDDGYGHHQQGNTESYYDNEQNGQYYDQNGYDAHGAPAHDANAAPGQDGYYDES